jgi:hypothetical protein
VVGDAVADKPLRTIALDKPYPRGVAIKEKIDRLLATSTVRATDIGDPGEAISVIELSTGKSLRSIKVSNKASPTGDAPVEILFAPGANPLAAHVTNMYGGTLWILRWNADKKDFDASQAVEAAADGEGPRLFLPPYAVGLLARGPASSALTAHLWHLMLKGEVPV